MYLITNRKLCNEERYIQILKEASYSGVEYIILREKDLDDKEVEALYYKIRNNINQDTKIIINSNIKVFKKVDADGIHLPFQLFIKEYNSIKNTNKIIGVSIHSKDEIKQILNLKLSYVTFSHIYITKCKEGLEPKGIKVLNEIKKVLKKTDIKLVALGGITPMNSKNTLMYCDDIAVMSTIMQSENVRKDIYKYY